MKMAKFNLALLLMLLLSALPLWSQATMDTTFKGSSAIASHLMRLRAPMPNARPSDLEMRLDINFDFNSAELRPLAKRQLDTLAKVLNSSGFTNTAIELAGHTCDLGQDSVNLGLSQRRVKSAIDYLARTGKIERRRLSQIAYGEKLPLIVGARDESERQLNRRVVVYLPENREAIEKMLREMPMTQGFRWGVFRVGSGGRETLISYDGSAKLHSGDQYRIYMRPAAPRYVYLFQQDSQGNAHWIFPRPDKGVVNPLMSGEYYLPDRSEVFVLDNTVGQETISLVVLEEPNPELEQLAAQQEPKDMVKKVTRTVIVRGLKEVRAGQLAESAAPRAQSVQVLAPGQRPVRPAGEKKIAVQPSATRDVLAVMAQHREFRMELRFEHQASANETN